MKQSLPLLILALSALSVSQADTFWAEGVSATSGWFDTNKAYNPVLFQSKGGENVTADTASTAAVFKNKDSQLCWAASASNILLYMSQQAGWQTAYSSTYLAATSESTLDKLIRERCQYSIYEAFTSNYEDTGWTVYDGLAWYTTGSMAYNYSNVSAAPLKEGASAGGYYSSLLGTTLTDFRNKVLSTHYQFLGSGYAGTYCATSSNGLTIGQGFFAKQVTYTSLFEEALADGAIALSITKEKTGHAITCWGYETDENNTLTSLYVTDSDDGAERLMKVAVSIGTDGVLYLGTTDAGTVKIYDASGAYTGYVYKSTDYTGCSLSAISSYTNFYPAAVPEPATATLGLLALTAIAARRRRRN